MSNPWPSSRLGDVVREEREQVGTLDGNGLPVLGVTNVEGVTQTGVEASDDKSKYLRLRPSRFVYNPYRINVGSIGLSSESQDGICSPAYVIFVPTERIEADFLRLYLKSARGNQLINFHGNRGSVRSALRFDDLCEIEIPLPPVAEQRRVVTRIEELIATIDEVRTLRHQAADETAALVPSGMADKFRRLAEEHPIKKLKTLCDVVRGGSPRPAGSPSYYGGTIPFLKVGDLTKDDGMYVYEASATVNEFGREQSRYIEGDTLMLTNSGATLGVPKITKIAGCFNDGSQAFLNLDSSVSKEYLYYLFKSKTLWFREQLARGQGQPNLNTDMTKQMDVPVPPLAKQRRIVAELDALQAEVDALKRLQAETSVELDALLPSILDKAFKGEL